MSYSEYLGMLEIVGSRIRWAVPTFEVQTVNDNIDLRGLFLGLPAGSLRGLATR
jgi:2-keto-4-pentenoate hydratase